MFEYVIGPIVALMISMKFTDYKSKKNDKQCDNCCERIELVEQKVAVAEQETLKKVIITITPMAKAIKQLQEAVGVQ